MDCVVVGCDRVAANGDTANKIGAQRVAALGARSGFLGQSLGVAARPSRRARGAHGFPQPLGTYALAVACAHHGLPFFVAGHSSTLDPQTATGSAIPIEERPGAELTALYGKARR